VAHAFADRGAEVVLLGRTAAEIDERAAAITRAGGSARAFACDLADEAQVRAVADEVSAASGRRAHALVNMAGGFALSGPVAESDAAVLQRMIAINLMTAYLTTRAFVPLLRAAKGSIVYFASAAVLPGSSGAKMSGYAAAKAGVVVLMRAVAEEERAAGVRANAVAPTAIRTGDNVREMGEAARYVEREDVAGAVLFLCSEAARAVTGQLIELR
jgi:NAD(P)-dependent dehydrogenase (short-subunit alcohol dehydrogenase family)